MDGSREMVEREIVIENDGPAGIAADVRTEAPGSPLPVIILCHGFLGHRRWGWFPYLSRKLAGSGFHTITFSFSMNGYQQNEDRITEPIQFAGNTVSREVRDLKRVMKYVRENFPFPAAECSPGLFGHSRGGAVSIIAAAGSEEVRSLVTWSTPSQLDRYTDRRRKHWKKTGKLVFRNNGSGGPLFLDYSYYLDIDRNREEYNLPLQMSRVKAPHLIIHGERDAAVTLREARELISRTGTGRVRFEVMEGSGHTFGVNGPMDLPPPRELDTAAGKTSQWFCDTLECRKETNE